MNFNFRDVNNDISKDPHIPESRMGSYTDQGARKALDIRFAENMFLKTVTIQIKANVNCFPVSCGAVIMLYKVVRTLDWSVEA